MEGFYVTNKGIELINSAVPSESKVEIKKAKFGSGGDNISPWNYDITALNSEEYSKDLDPETDKYQISPTDPKALLITVTVPQEQSFTINEVGFFDTNDNLIIYGIVREFEKLAGVMATYNCWVKFDNVDTANVEIKIVSSEFEKVEQLVEDTRTEFNQKIQQIESEFDISNYVTQEQFEGLDDKFAEKTEIERLEGEITTLDGKIVEDALSKSEASSTYLNKQVASQTYVAKKAGYDLVSTTDIEQITTNKGNISSLQDSVGQITSQLEGVETTLTSINSRLGGVV